MTVQPESPQTKNSEREWRRVLFWPIVGIVALVLILFVGLVYIYILNSKSIALETDEFVGIIEMISASFSVLVWPALVSLVVIFFRKPLEKLIVDIAESAISVKIFEVEWKREDVSEFIVEREILRVGLETAAADGRYLPNELERLSDRAFAMSKLPEKLSETGREQALREAVNIAAADGDIGDTERKEILKIALRELHVDPTAE